MARGGLRRWQMPDLLQDFEAVESSGSTWERPSCAAFAAWSFCQSSPAWTSTTLALQLWQQASLENDETAPDTALRRC